MEYFPLGLAEGKAFCNRATERNKLKKNIELSKLSLVQKKIMILIARGQLNGFSKKESLQKMSTTSGAVVKALKSLISKDYIYEDQGSVYKIIDPLISASIKNFFPIDELI